MIVHAFISRNDDWILAHHLAAYSEFCDRIICVLDDWPQSEAICRRFPKCEVHHRPRQQDLPVCNSSGVLMEEGRLRQMAWDLAMAYRPTLIVTGDTDETPTPDIPGWLLSKPDPSVEVWYADWVNLFGGVTHAIGGNSRWSFQAASNNKKGLVIRPMPGKTYRYRDALQHVRMEPNPLGEADTIHDETHRLGPVKLIHYKWANWKRWQDHPLSRDERYGQLLDHSELVPVPASWRWSFPIEALKE